MGYSGSGNVATMRPPRGTLEQIQHERDQKLAADVIYAEWHAATPYRRARSFWVMSPGMRDWLVELFPPRTPPPPVWTPALPIEPPPPPNEPDKLMARPVVLREDAFGIHLEMS